MLLRQVRLRGHNLRHVLILGTNPRAVEFARKIESKPELGYEYLASWMTSGLDCGTFRDH